MVEVIEQKMGQVIEERMEGVTGLIMEHSTQLQTAQNTRLPPYSAPHRRRPPKGTKSRKANGIPNNLTSPRAEGVSVRVAQFASVCRSGCLCECHSQTKAATPNILTQMLGKLFIQYAGVPLMSPKCSLAGCQTAQVPMATVEYWFPLGFCWSQIIHIQAGYRPGVGPQFNLRTLRQVPDSAQCVTYAMEGNIEGLKDLFKRGMASPLDVSSTRGYTMLRVSSSHYQIYDWIVH
jgi:hypothetical protein